MTIRNEFHAFKAQFEADQLLLEAIETLDPVEKGTPNRYFFEDHTVSKSRQSVVNRKKKQLLLAAFYAANPNLDFDVIQKINKENQSQKKYFDNLYQTIHPDQAL